MFSVSHATSAWQNAGKGLCPDFSPVAKFPPFRKVLYGCYWGCWRQDSHTCHNLLEIAFCIGCRLLQPLGSHDCRQLLALIGPGILVARGRVRQLKRTTCKAGIVFDSVYSGMFRTNVDIQCVCRTAQQVIIGVIGPWKGRPNLKLEFQDPIASSLWRKRQAYLLSQRSGTITLALHS